MKLPPFYLEEFWKKYEFTAPHILCSSVTEVWSMNEILGLSDEATRSLWDALHFGYTESCGLPQLLEEIASLYENFQKENILTFAGAEEGIYCALHTLVEAQDHVIVVGPCYQSLAALPIALGAEVTQIEIQAEKNWELSRADFKNAFRPNTKLVILNDPHSPTGGLLKKEVYEEIIHLARERGSYIFNDEVYRYLEFNEQNRLPSIAEMYERGLSLNVMSKSFGLPGLRIGWIACRDSQILEKICSYKFYTTICNSAPSEILALMALRAKERLLGRNRKILLDNFSELERFLERNKGIFSWVKPQAGTTAAIKLQHEMKIQDFAERLVEESGLLIMPMQVYGFKGNYFRLGFGKKNTPQLLKLFEESLNKVL